MNGARVPDSPPVMTVRLRSVDGSVFWIISRSPVDYVLNPAFLKFVIVCCALYALLDQGRDVPGLTIWFFMIHWGVVLTVILVWLGISGGVIRLLFRRRLIRQVWTPVVLLPMIVLIEATIQGLTYGSGLLPLKPWEVTMTDLTRDFMVLMLFDYLHGQFVVARHPQAFVDEFSRDDPEFPPLPKAPSLPSGELRPVLTPESPVADDEPVVAPTPAPAPSLAERSERIQTQRSGSVRIGTETFRMSDILMIRIEDHYLGITTRAGRSLQRAKLAAIEGLHDGDLGIQINRSVWVAFSAIREGQMMKNGQILLVLVNGDEEMVSKPRVYAFRQAYRRTQPDGVDPFA